MEERTFKASKMLVTLFSVVGKFAEAKLLSDPVNPVLLQDTPETGLINSLEPTISEKMLLCMEHAHALSFCLARSTGELSSVFVR